MHFSDVTCELLCLNTAPFLRSGRPGSARLGTLKRPTKVDSTFGQCFFQDLLSCMAPLPGFSGHFCTCEGFETHSAMPPAQTSSIPLLVPPSLHHFHPFSANRQAFAMQERLHAWPQISYISCVRRFFTPPFRPSPFFGEPNVFD